METSFAPAGRATVEALQRETRRVADSALFQVLLRAWVGYVLVLNEQRQVLAINPRALRDLGLPGLECLMGLRPGELLGCVHSTEGPDGCGTSEACTDCGAVRAVLEATHSEQPAERECHLALAGGRAMDLHVRATPVVEAGQRFTVVGMTDISDALWRQALERTFFHDARNTLAGLVGWSELVAEGTQGRRAAERVRLLAQRLHGEIEAHRLLVEAEAGRLEPRLAPVLVHDLLCELELLFADRHQRLLLHPDPGGLVTDRVLLLRVLANMVSNALEATRTGQLVEIELVRSPGPTFRVSNPGEIPSQVARRIFERSFSTKGGHGRGLGTWSMKLLGEVVLGGRVGFDSAAGRTTFWLTLPS